jgi:hypothetical protein
MLRDEMAGNARSISLMSMPGKRDDSNVRDGRLDKTAAERKEFAPWRAIVDDLG